MMKNEIKSAVVLALIIVLAACKTNENVAPTTPKPCLLLKEEAAWESGSQATAYTYTPEGYLLSSERKFTQQTMITNNIPTAGYTNNETITNTYDANGFLTKSVNVLSGTSQKADGTTAQSTNTVTSVYIYQNDKLAKIETTSANTPTQTTVKEYEYDTNNNVLKKTDKTLNGTTATYSMTTAYVYSGVKITETQLTNNLTRMVTVSNVLTDAKGRITKESNPFSTKTVVYNEDGVVLKSDYNYNNTTTGYAYEYDEQKAFVKGIPSKGIPSEPQWGVASSRNQTKVVNSFTAGKLGGTTTVQDTYEYDTNGLPKSSKRITTTVTTNINLNPANNTTTTTKIENVTFTVKCD